MSFDTTAAKKTIATLQAHRSHPGGEVMLQAADLLTDAMTDAANAMASVRNAEASELKAKRDNEGALLEIKELRERVAIGDKAIETLKQAAAKKSIAGKLAVQFLTANGLIESPLVP